MLNIEILFQDNYFLAVNKPSGLLVHRSHECSDKTNLLKITRAQSKKWLYPFQRLDRGVSGIVIFGLSQEAVKAMQNIWRAPETQKKYIALVRGSDVEDQIIDFPLTNKYGEKQEAISEVKVLERFNHQSLLEVSIKTGRQHQIRRHLSRRMMAIIGDTKYGKGGLNRLFREKYKLHRIFLHCHQLIFNHPFTKQQISIQCSLPLELLNTIVQLRAERDEF